MVLDSLANAARYYALHPAFQKAFDFIKNTDFSSQQTGKIVIDGDNLFINHADCCGKTVEQAKIETHNQYIDIQVAYQQAEQIGYAPRCELKEPIGEYDAAKDEQRDIEARIEEIDNILKNAEVVAEDEGDADSINIGCTVKIKDLDFDEVLEYKIVGSTESDVLNGKISNESPVGVALIGSKTGDVVEVETPSGEMVKYEVLEFQKSAMI